MVPLKLGQTRKRQKCLTTISTYFVFTSSDFVLPNMEVLVKPTNLISDISHPCLKKFIKYLVLCRLKGLWSQWHWTFSSSSLCLPINPYTTPPFSLSLNNGIVPTEWRLHMHAITPVFKSGDKSKVKNYLPISLLSNTSKALERLV